MARSARTIRILRRPTSTPACFTRALQGAKLCHMGHLMMENRNGLIVDARLTEANGTAERTTALEIIDDNAKLGSTVGADENYDTADFVTGCRERGCTPHLSRNDINRHSAIDARTARNPGYHISTIKRNWIERTIRVDQDGRRSAQDPASWPRPGQSGFSCSPPQPAISFVFRRCWQQRDEPVWSVKHERKLRVQRSLLSIDWLILAPHIRKIALKGPFFSSLLVLADTRHRL
ncbi:hypothetical protein ACVWWO_003616 [Bradyrhizobium sp. F1.13.1]